MELRAEGRQTCSSRGLLEEGVDAGDNTENVSNPGRKKVVRYCGKCVHCEEDETRTFDCAIKDVDLDNNSRIYAPPMINEWCTRGDEIFCRLQLTRY